jgi:hypothetical protein
MPWDKLLLQQLLRETAVPVMPPVNTAVAMPGDEGRDCHDHDFAVVADAVVFLSEEDELAVVSVWQSHERCCCLHMPYHALSWHADRDGSWQSGLPDLLLLFSCWRRWLFLLFLRWRRRQCEDGNAKTVTVSRSFLC